MMLLRFLRHPPYSLFNCVPPPTSCTIFTTLVRVTGAVTVTAVTVTVAVAVAVTVAVADADAAAAAAAAVSSRGLPSMVFK